MYAACSVLVKEALSGQSRGPFGACMLDKSGAGSFLPYRTTIIAAALIPCASRDIFGTDGMTGPTPSPARAIPASLAKPLTSKASLIYGHVEARRHSAVQSTGRGPISVLAPRGTQRSADHDHVSRPRQTGAHASVSAAMPATAQVSPSQRQQSAVRQTGKT